MNFLLFNISYPLYRKLDRNSLTGEIPTELGQLISLTRLFVFFFFFLILLFIFVFRLPYPLSLKLFYRQFNINSLTGQIPSTLGQITPLATLFVSFFCYSRIFFLFLFLCPFPSFPNGFFLADICGIIH